MTPVEDTVKSPAVRMAAKEVSPVSVTMMSPSALTAPAALSARASIEPKLLAAVLRVIAAPVSFKVLKTAAPVTATVPLSVMAPVEVAVKAVAEVAPKSMAAFS